MRRFLLPLLLTCAAWGQPAFDAASVKPSKSVDNSSTFNTRSDNVQGKNVDLRELLLFAFDLKPYQLIGPEWLSAARFDIVAKAPFGTGDDEKLMPLLRTLLTERFKLQTHRETRELPCFALLPAKDGIKLHEAGPEAGGSSMNSNSNQNGGELKAKKTTMARFAEWLSRQMQRPVIDATGIKAAYDFTLQYSKENANRLAGLEQYPILTLAIQEQLGLRLEKRTAPIDVVVIDHAERVPSDN